MLGTRLLQRHAWLLLLFNLFACGGDDGWSGSVQVDAETIIDFPTLVGNSTDHTLALWRQPRPDGGPPFDGIVASWRQAMGRWGPATIIDDYQSVPRAISGAVDDEGNAVVVWLRAPPGVAEPPEVWSTRYLEAQGWQQPEVVENAFFASADPLVTFDSTGTAFAVWERRSGIGSEEIALSEYRSGEGWGEPAIYPIGAERGTVSLLALGTGTGGQVVIAWWVGRELEVVRYTSGAGWSAADTFRNDALLGPPQVEVDAQGAVWAFWSGRASTGTCAGVARNTPSGWESPTIFENGCDGGAGGALSLGAQGGAIAIWTQGLLDDSTAFWSLYNPAAGWSPSAQMPIGEGRSPAHFGAGVFPDGSAAALWYRLPSTPTLTGQLAVWSSSLSVDGVWSNPLRLTENGVTLSLNGPFSPPAVVAYPDGRAIGVWVELSLDAVGRTLWASEYR